jgi:outer membrane protein insertion porin family
VSGNTKTRDEIIRREMRQMDASWASSSKIERSKTRLERLGYFESVNVETPPVVGTADQIDANFTVVEKASGNLSAGVGFSQVQGIVLNANISQDNVFGSGKRVNLAFNNSDFMTNYQFGFFNPYFTVDGISQGFNIGYAKRNAGAVNIANYSTDIFNTGINFGIPLNEFDQIRFDTDIKHTTLRTNDCNDNYPDSYFNCFYTSEQIRQFIREEGTQFWTFGQAVSWSHDTLNRAIFPNKGGQQRLSGLIMIPGSDLEYYKVSYRHQHYFPLAKDLTFKLNGEIAYGGSYGNTDGLPFFDNYFMGGTGSVRGFRNNTLGPRDSNGNPIGGASKIIANAELFFPVPFLSETKSVRLGTFVDAGALNDSFSVDGMRFSAGISGEWLSPFGALSVSAAYPINKGTYTYYNPLANRNFTQDDQTEYFQFNFGQNF